MTGADDEAGRERRAGRSPAPRHTPRLVVEVTSRCNRACAYCSNPWKVDPTYPRRELAPPDRLALVRRVLRESGIAQVEISGGEPLMSEGLVELIEGIRSSEVAVSMVTDGGLLDDAMARTLARLGVGPVQPTLLAADRDLHDRLKGAAAFDSTVEAIGSLKRAGVPVAVAFVCTRANYRAFREVVDLCFALDVRAIAFSRLCAAGEGGRRLAELMPTWPMIASCLDVAEAANARLGMRVQIAIPVPLCAFDPRRYRHLAFGRCAQSGGTPHYVLDPAGNLRACGVSSTILGSPLREPWAAIMARTRETYLPRLSRSPEPCASCPLLARCGGGCRESALTCYGDLSRPDPLSRPGRRIHGDRAPERGAPR